MKLYATSDLHLDFAANMELLRGVAPHTADWLVLAGDVSHKLEHLLAALDLLAPRFHRLAWVPGNHDLWNATYRQRELRGEEKYQLMVELCRERGVLTPEDPYPTLELDTGTFRLAPLFVLYDYSFRPADVPEDLAVLWAAKSNVLSTDEYYLNPAPHSDRTAWCAHRCQLTEPRLSEAASGTPEIPLVLVNHFPLRQDLIRIFIPRFSIWCGTRRTEDWHLRFNAEVVISGHLHVPCTRLRDGVRFEEVSLGYPRQWRRRGKEPEVVRRVL